MSRSRSPQPYPQGSLLVFGSAEIARIRGGVHRRRPVPGGALSLSSSELGGSPHVRQSVSWAASQVEKTVASPFGEDVLARSVVATARKGPLGATSPRQLFGAGSARRRGGLSAGLGVELWRGLRPFGGAGSRGSPAVMSSVGRQLRCPSAQAPFGVLGMPRDSSPARVDGAWVQAASAPFGVLRSAVSSS